MKQSYDNAMLSRPPREKLPGSYRDTIDKLFEVWDSKRGRNRTLTAYYTMKNELKDLGISIPENLLNLNCVVGWCKKAVDARVNRSVFDGFVTQGSQLDELDRLVIQNRLRTKIAQATKSSLVHGLSAVTVMKGNKGEPPVMVRTFSANQFACLWNKDKERIGSAIALLDVDENCNATKYVAYFDDALLTMEREGETWSVSTEQNIMGRPLMELLINDPDIDRPLGHSLLTPELLGIVDKAMRDVLRMEVGAEFFTFPQRYILGASEDMFSTMPEGATQSEDGTWRDVDGNEVQPVSSEYAKFKAYIGALLAISRDENGDIPSVGQFSASTADNFTAVFENDAQRFSGATNVPLAQLGVLSNTYTSSDALSATDNPLILAVESMNRQYGEALANIGRMMLAVLQECTLDKLSEQEQSIQCAWKDPSMPTLSSRADAWTKLASVDNSIVGTRVFYEGLGLTQATIDRLEAQKQNNSAINALNAMADMMAEGANDRQATV